MCAVELVPHRQYFHAARERDAHVRDIEQDRAHEPRPAVGERRHEQRAGAHGVVRGEDGALEVIRAVPCCSRLPADQRETTNLWLLAIITLKNHA